jgi:allantoinase
MQAAAAAGVPVAVHCEDARHFGPGGERPVSSEVAAVAQAGAAAAAHGAALHVVHCSSADAVLEALRWPRTSVETCPHYLALTDEDVRHIGTDAVCCPPIRDADNRRRLLELAAGGAVQSVASDHSPCSPLAKEHDPPFAGVAGVETALSVMLSLPSLTLEHIERLRTNAAALCGLGHKGAVAPGYDADLALVDLHAAWEVGPTTLHSRHRRSPFTGRRLPGVVVATLLRGTVVYESGGQAAEPAGRDARRASSARR